MQRSRPLHLLYPRPALRCLVTRRALCITSPAILRPTTLDVEPGRAPPELHRRFASRGPMCGTGSVIPEPLHIGRHGVVLFAAVMPGEGSGACMHRLPVS